MGSFLVRLSVERIRLVIIDHAFYDQHIFPSLSGLYMSRDA